jgi:hypothetical protein
MKFLKDINENFSFKGLVAPPAGALDPVLKDVQGWCVNIAMEDLKISEKSFAALDRLDALVQDALSESFNEFNTIVSNCHQRNMRRQYCAEVVYHTLLQGKLRARNERSWTMGGFKPDQAE